MSRSTGVGVIGLGFMGRTHVRAYRHVAAHGAPNRLVAVADADPSRFSGEGFAKGNIEGDDDGGLTIT